MTPVEEAYRRCEQITWSEARNFAYGIRLLPKPKRRAMAALYAMARRIDDVGDGDWPQERKLEALTALHETISSLEAGALPDPADPVLTGIAHAASHFPIPLAALHEIVEGCEHDTRGETYATMDDTVRYCRLVAGSVGRLSLGVFGAREPRRTGSHSPTGTGGDDRPAEDLEDDRPAEDLEDDRPAEELADDLGVALQLTNMLRDIKEDWQMGRIYLPEQDRERFGIAPSAWEPVESVAALVEYVGEQAAAWFNRGLPLLKRLDPRSRACTAAMSGIYRRLLLRILAQPASPLTERLSLPMWEKVLVALRSLSGLHP